MTSVPLTTVMVLVLAELVPKCTAVVPVRLVPVMVTTVPPPSGPATGATAVTVGHPQR